MYPLQRSFDLVFLYLPNGEWRSEVRTRLSENSRARIPPMNEEDNASMTKLEEEGG